MAKQKRRFPKLEPQTKALIALFVGGFVFATLLVWWSGRYFGVN